MCSDVRRLAIQLMKCSYWSYYKSRKMILTHTCWSVLSLIFLFQSRLQVSAKPLPAQPVLPANTDLGAFRSSDEACQAIYRNTDWAKALPSTYKLVNIVISTSARFTGRLSEVSFFCIDIRNEFHEMPAGEVYSHGPFRMSCLPRLQVYFVENAINSFKAVCQGPTLPMWRIDELDEREEVEPGTTSCVNLPTLTRKGMGRTVKLWTNKVSGKGSPQSGTSDVDWFTISSPLDKRVYGRSPPHVSSYTVYMPDILLARDLRACAHAISGLGTVYLHVGLG